MTNGTLPQVIHDLSGPYVLRRLLGSGAFGATYEATDPQGRPCAVKWLRFPGPHPTVREACLKEVTRLVIYGRLPPERLVGHPNIVYVRGFLECGGEHFIVMELCGGKPIPIEGSFIRGEG